MSDVSYTYDTAAIRRTANQIKGCGSVIEHTALSKVKNARSRLEDNFKGRTADALDESLVQMLKQLRTLNDDLRGLSATLSGFADRLEEADERVARLFGK